MTNLSVRMTTDEEKSKLAKLLQGIETPEVKLTEKCSDLLNVFKEKFGQDVEVETVETKINEELGNPYKCDKQMLEVIDKRLYELQMEGKREKKQWAESKTDSESKKPWRTNSSKERLLRVENELKRHHEKANDMILPLADGDMKELIKECKKETLISAPVPADRLRNTVDAAKKILPNFQYRKIENSTATSILPEAHQLDNSETGS